MKSGSIASMITSGSSCIIMFTIELRSIGLAIFYTYVFLCFAILFAISVYMHLLFPVEPVTMCNRMFIRCGSHTQCDRQYWLWCANSYVHRQLIDGYMNNMVMFSLQAKTIFACYRYC